jgi:hypothetical protein
MTDRDLQCKYTVMSKLFSNGSKFYYGYVQKKLDCKDCNHSIKSTLYNCSFARFAKFVHEIIACLNISFSNLWTNVCKYLEIKQSITDCHAFKRR